jgi:hypothetical protein
LGKSGLSLVRRTSGVPFPYVVLGGRDDVAAQIPVEAELGVAASKNSSGEREWFAAHVESNAPRWNDAREALVRSLAVPDVETTKRALSGLKDDSAWDEGASAVPVVPLVPLPVVKEAVEPPAIKLRAKRRAPSLPSIDSAKIAQTREVSAEPQADAAEAALPILKDGLAPLVPLPALPAVEPLASAPFAARPAYTKSVDAPPVTDTKPGSGFVKYALGMAFLCALIVATGYLLFLQFGSKIFDQPSASRSALVETVPLVVTQAEEAKIAPVEAQPAESGIVAPVVAKTAMPDEATGPARPSAAFENYVAGLRVSGVLLGSSPRALINGRTVHIGDVLDPVLGVRLVEVDGASRHLVFEDATTASIRARY